MFRQVLRSGMVCTTQQCQLKKQGQTTRSFKGKKKKRKKEMHPTRAPVVYRQPLWITLQPAPALGCY